jgi:serine/threonine-protein kinase RsbT
MVEASVGPWEAVMADRIRIPIESEGDIVTARHHGRALARHLDFSATDRIRIVTAVTEVARNLLDHSAGGEILLSLASRPEEEGIVIVGRDRGPGIPDVDRALQVGFSTRGGMGLGLSGIKSLTHEFAMESRVPSGTTVTAKRWVGMET